MVELYRRDPDSSTLAGPRTLCRVLATPGELTAVVGFYSTLTGVDPDMDMAWPEVGMHIVAIAGFLILELDPEAHPAAAAAQATVIVAELATAVHQAVEHGATVLEAAHPAPVGAAARLRHPDGLLVEYLEHRPNANDVDTAPLKSQN